MTGIAVGDDGTLQVPFLLLVFTAFIDLGRVTKEQCGLQLWENHGT